jgi:putative phosphoesterase
VTKVVVLADTHIVGSGSERLPAPVWDALRSAEVILHAGDVVSAEFLDELRALAPLHAVLGNNDRTLVGVLPDQVELEFDGVRIAMLHDSGARRGREGRIARRFPSARVVVFGHSHIPWNEPGIEGQLLFNPGSATQRRSQPRRTFGVLQFDRGEVKGEIVPT